MRVRRWPLLVVLARLGLACGGEDRAPDFAAGPGSGPGPGLSWAVLLDGEGGVSGIAATEDGGMVAVGWYRNTFVIAPGTPGEATLQGDEGFYGFFIVRLGADGSPTWVRSVRAEEGSEVFDVAVAADGGVWVTGSSSGETVVGGQDGPETVVPGSGPLVARFGREGQLSWAHRASRGWIRAAGNDARLYGHGSATVYRGEPDEVQSPSGIAFVAELRADGSLADLRGLGDGDPWAGGETGAVSMLLDDSGALTVAGTFCGDAPVWGGGPGTPQPRLFCCDGDSCDVEEPTPTRASLFVAKYEASGRVTSHAIAPALGSSAVLPWRVLEEPHGLLLTGSLRGAATFGGLATLSGEDERFFARWDERGGLETAEMGTLASTQARAGNGDLLGAGALERDFPQVFGRNQVRVGHTSGFFARWREDTTLAWVRLFPGALDSACCSVNPGCCQMAAIQFIRILEASDGGILTWAIAYGDYPLEDPGTGASVLVRGGFLAKWR